MPVPVSLSLGLGLKSSYVVTAHGELFQCGQYHSALTAERGILTRVEGVGPVRGAACCRDNAVFVTAGGGVVAARDGVWEAPAHRLHGVTQAACGDGHYAAVTGDGGLYLWGDGAAGQLGMGVARYDADGEVDPEVYDDQLTELNWQSRPVQLPRESLGMLAVLMVACGDRHTLVLTEGGCVFSFGSGRHGQLGHGHGRRRDAARPTLIEMHGDDAVKASGEKDTAEAVETTDIPPRFEAMETTRILPSSQALNFTDIPPSLQTPVDTARMPTYTARMPPDTARMPTDTTQIPTDTAQKTTDTAPKHSQHPAGIFRVAYVAAGGDHSMAVTSTGSLYAWGSNRHRQLGLAGNSHTTPFLVAIGKNKPVALASVATSSAHTLAVSTSGTVYACGSNPHGQLGLGDTEDRRRFKRIRPFAPGKIVEAAAGPSTSAAVTENGELWTWGRGAHGCLGHGGESDAVAPARVVAMSVDYPLQAVGAGPLSVYMQHAWAPADDATHEPRPGVAVSMLPPQRRGGHRDADRTAIDPAGLGRWHAAVEPEARWFSPIARGPAGEARRA